MSAPAQRTGIPEREAVAEFAKLGITAFTTTRTGGDFALADDAPPESNAASTSRWTALQASLEPRPVGLVCSRQVHETRVAEHRKPWEGWLRLDGFDAHLVSTHRGAAAITVADCVPVFIAHPSGTVAIVHAGWRGVAGGILSRALAAIESSLNSSLAPRAEPLGPRLSAHDCSIHLGPAICGRCYEVGPDVYEQLTGWQTIRNRHVDLRALLAEQAKQCGVAAVSASAWCTRCDNERFFSHRAGDGARQIAVIVSGVRQAIRPFA